VARELAIPKTPVRVAMESGGLTGMGGHPLWSDREIGGFWGEQPGAGGTAHFGTVARPTATTTSGRRSSRISFGPSVRPSANVIYAPRNCRGLAPWARPHGSLGHRPRIW